MEAKQLGKIMSADKNGNEPSVFVSLSGSAQKDILRYVENGDITFSDAFRVQGAGFSDENRPYITLVQSYTVIRKRKAEKEELNK